jgi:integrase
MRKGEILGLNWDQIKNGMIYLRKTKTDNPRQIPVNDTVQELLGHRAMTMTLRYAHLTQEHKKNAVNLLNDLPAPTPAGKPTCDKSGTKTKPRARALG